MCYPGMGVENTLSDRLIGGRDGFSRKAHFGWQKTGTEKTGLRPRRGVTFARQADNNERSIEWRNSNQRIDVLWEPMRLIAAAVG